jgi:DNA-binding NtrC family response regulator
LEVREASGKEASMQAYPKVVMIAGDPDDFQVAEVLARLAAVTRVERTAEAMLQLESGDCDVLFCPWQPAEGTWRDVLDTVHKWHVGIPVVVFCHCGGEHEWTEVLNAGAFDLLVPPYESHQVRELLEHALESRYSTAGSRVYA